MEAPELAIAISAINVEEVVSALSTIAGRLVLLIVCSTSAVSFKLILTLK